MASRRSGPAANVEVEQARAGQEDQGVNTLFLALGMLHYAGPAGGDVYRAPLLMLPVQLARRSARAGYAGYTVSATDEEPLVNPAPPRRGEIGEGSTGLALRA